MLSLLVCVSAAIVPFGQVAYNRLLDPVFFFLNQLFPLDSEVSFIKICSTGIDILHLNL